MDILISEKVDLRQGTIARLKEGNFVMIKRSIHQGDIITLNVYVLNNIAKIISSKKCQN